MDTNGNFLLQCGMDWSLFTQRYQEVIPDFDQFIYALEKPFPVGLRYGGDEVLKKIQALCEAPSYRPHESLPFIEVPGERKFWGSQLLHHHGGYFMQALSSLFPVLALAPGEEDLVWDMCAAPGGKTGHLSELMNNKGMIVASEPDLGRRRILKANLNRLGVCNVCIYEGLAQEIQFPSESFDKILLDGPCSSEGTFRLDTISGGKRRKVNYLTYNKSFREELHREQAALIRHGFSKLKPGGQMVYSTCTYDPHENEKIVSDFLKEHNQAKLEDLHFPLKEKLSLGLTHYQGEDFHPDLVKSVRVYPHQLNSIGFYVAKISKTS